MTTVGDGLFQYGGAPVGLDYPLFRKNGHVWFVDGTLGLDGNTGRSPDDAYQTIAKAVAVAGESDTIFIFPQTMDQDPGLGSADPVSYDETIIIDQPSLSLIGVSHGRTQGGLPQIKIGAGTTAMIQVRAPGCFIANLGINGASSTGGGIKLVDDGGATYCAYGTTIQNCHFKNCATSATVATGGGAIYTTTDGGAWQLLVKDCSFYKCLGGIIVPGTSVAVPQDWVIDNCLFNSTVKTEIDADIYVAGSGIKGFSIRNCTFGTIDVPTAASGAVKRYIKLADGSYGTISNCTFACICQGTSTVTFGAAGSAVYVPTTVRMAGCTGEAASDATGDCSHVIRNG